MLKIRGHVQCVLRDKNGNIVQIESDKNTSNSDLKVDSLNTKKTDSPTNQETDKLNPNH